MEYLMRPITILDGGMSRELIRLNAPFRQPEWSALALLEAPHFVSKVHQDFLDAGADVITTNSYAIVPYHIGEERFWKDGEQLAALAGRLAREAADEAAAASGRQIRVAGCLPPIFGSYEPAKFDGSAVGKYLEVLVRALDPYVDLWLAETLSLVSEAQAAYDATSRTKKPFWVAFTPDDSSTASKTTPCLRSGEPLEKAARWAFSTDVQALLFNCARPEYMIGGIEVAASVSSTCTESCRPLLGVYANAFEPRSDEYAANENICPTDDKLNTKVYSDFASEWIRKGVDIVGGCCGVGHEHIQYLSQAFKGRPGQDED
jgi:homocysteine S-methyltransferase